MEFNESINEIQFVHSPMFIFGSEIVHGTTGKTTIADKLNFNTGDIIETSKGVFVYNQKMNKFLEYNCSFGVIKYNGKDKWVFAYCIHKSDNPRLASEQSRYRLYKMIAKQLEKKIIIPTSEECIKRMTSELLSLPYTIGIYLDIVNSFTHWYKNNVNNVENDVSSIIAKTIEFIKLNFPNTVFNTEDIINNYKKFVLE